jgi:hypothetical protein
MIARSCRRLARCQGETQTTRRSWAVVVGLESESRLQSATVDDEISREGMVPLVCIRPKPQTEGREGPCWTGFPYALSARHPKPAF